MTPHDLEEIRFRNCGEENCWATEPRGKRLLCYLGLHKWALNFFRFPFGPDHYHCWWCAAGVDR